MSDAEISPVNPAAIRRRVEKSATIVDVTGSHPCVIREWSERGARIEVSGRASLPASFRLAVPADGIEVDCSVAWRHRDSIGIAFSGPVNRRAD